MVKCCKCKNNLSDFEAYIMKDVPDEALCYNCAMSEGLRE